MNQISPLNDLPPLLPVSDFKDRHAGLLVFGILEILLGVLCVVLVGFMVLGQVMASRATGAALNSRMLLPGVLFYIGERLWLGFAPKHLETVGAGVLIIGLFDGLQTRFVGAVRMEKQRLRHRAQTGVASHHQSPNLHPYCQDCGMDDTLGASP